MGKQGHPQTSTCCSIPWGHQVNPLVLECIAPLLWGGMSPEGCTISWYNEMDWHWWCLSELLQILPTQVPSAQPVLQEPCKVLLLTLEDYHIQLHNSTNFTSPRFTSTRRVPSESPVPTHSRLIAHLVYAANQSQNSSSIPSSAE